MRAIVQESEVNSIRSMFAFDPSIDPEKFAKSCTEWGINMPLLHPGFLNDEKMAKALDKEGLALWLNLPVFHDPPYLERHPESYAITNRGRRAIQDWLHFACPSREEYLDRFVKEMRGCLSKRKPAVVSLDFIRHFVFWERVDLNGPSSSIEDGCYCPVCLSSFERECGEKLDKENAATYIRRHLKKQWGDWKCRCIAEVAERLFEEIRSLTPGVKLAIKTLPWRESDLDGAIRISAGQDVQRLTRNLDMVAPMAFTQILGRTPEWKRELLSHVREITGKPTLFYVQTEGLYRPEEITPSQFEEELRSAFGDEYAGIAIFHYEQLVANPEKAKILRKYAEPVSSSNRH